MARIRSVHPGLFSDEAFVSCSPSARLMAIGLWTEADDKGVFEWKPLTIKMRLFPADAFGTCEMVAMLEELSTANIIRRFDSDDKPYGAIRNFRKYQRPQKPNDVHPLPTELLSYVGLSRVIPMAVQDQSRTGSGKPNQREDVGGRMDEEGDYNNHHIQEETHQPHTTRDDFIDSDGVIHDLASFEMEGTS